MSFTIAGSKDNWTASYNEYTVTGFRNRVTVRVGRSRTKDAPVANSGDWDNVGNALYGIYPRLKNVPEQVKEMLDNGIADFLT